MEKNSLVKRLAVYKRNQERYREIYDQVKPPAADEVVELVLQLLTQVQGIENTVKSGLLKGEKGEKGTDGRNGVTPVADKDYLSKQSAIAFINELFDKAQKNIRNGKDGNDGKDAVVTEAQIKEAAELAYEMITLPDFDTLITQNPPAVRDALELLQGEERLEQSAIKNLPETLNELRRQRALDVGGGTNTTRVRQIVQEMDDNGEINGQGASAASEVTYNNTTSGLTADNVQDALDELDQKKLNISAQITTYITVGSTKANYIIDGTDDDVQIQAAIDEATANGGGTVLLKAGTYNVSSSIFVKNNVFVIGEGQSHFSTTTLIQASSAIDIFIFNTTAPIGLRDLIIDGGGLANGVSFQKDALPKIKGTVLDRILIRDCVVGIDAVSSSINSGPFDDTAFLNLRLTNCTVGLRNWNVSTSIFGGVIGGCGTGVELLEACGLKTYGVVFTGNDVDFDALDQNPFSISINDSYFEGTTTAHFRRSIAGVQTMGSVNFRGCTFLNEIGTANTAFDFSESSGIASFDFCRFDANSPSSNIIDTNASTTVIVNNTQTTVVPTVNGSGSYRFTGATISGVGDITSIGNITAGMANNFRGFLGKSGNTNILTLLRQTSPVNASVIATVLGAFGITTGTSTAATSNYDFQINTTGQTTLTNTYLEQTANYTLTRDNRAGVVNFTGATTASATLPTTGNVSGDTYTIKNSGTGVITVVGTIDGVTNYSLANQYDALTVQYNGSDWSVVSKSSIETASTTLTWADYALNGLITNTTVIATGEVLTISLNNTDYYRYYTTATDANGYPVIDAIYSNFDGTNVPTGLLAERGTI